MSEQELATKTEDMNANTTEPDMPAAKRARQDEGPQIGSPKVIARYSVTPGASSVNGNLLIGNANATCL